VYTPYGMIRMGNKRKIIGGGYNYSDNLPSSEKETEKNDTYTNEDLKIMQGWSLDRKIQVSQAKVLEWYKKWEGQIYVSYSGGKDSTVLLHLVRRVLPDAEAVFVDTGLEYPELREHVKTVDNVTWLKPKMNFKEVIKKYGYPLISKEVSQQIYEIKHTKSDYLRNKRLYGDEKRKCGKLPNKYKYLLEAPFEVSSSCCEVMKKSPLFSYERKSGCHPYVGTMAVESRLRKQSWIKYGCNAFDLTHPKSRPLSFWNEQDVLEYILRYNLSIPPVYGDIKKDNNGNLFTTKCQRTGCVFCAYGCHLEKEPNRFQRLKETHPKLWEYCMKPWDEGGLGMREVLEYIGVNIE